MYASCLFCHADLGRNEVIAPLPIGRALAFDPDRGRLWVLCLRCAGWNLVPIGQRWEAVETCEALSRTLVRRYSTGQISLAVAEDRTRVIRIGDAQPGEFACWRYEPRFRRRRQRGRFRRAIAVVAVSGATAALAGTAYLTASVVVTGWTALMLGAYRPRRDPQVLAVLGEGGCEERIFDSELSDIRFASHEGQEALTIGMGSIKTRVYGGDIPMALGLVLPYVNRNGGRPSEIADAVGAIHDAGGAQRLLRKAVEGRWSVRSRAESKISRVRRLALEMAAHEEVEAEALTGELTRLERAWRRAEELASISDGLLMERETALLAKMKRDLTPLSKRTS